MHASGSAQSQREQRAFDDYVKQTADGNSNVDQLAKLADLKSQGVITDEEFEREKANCWADGGARAGTGGGIVWVGTSGSWKDDRRHRLYRWVYGPDTRRPTGQRWSPPYCRCHPFIEPLLTSPTRGPPAADVSYGSGSRSMKDGSVRTSADNDRR